MQPAPARGRGRDDTEARLRHGSDATGMTSTQAQGPETPRPGAARPGATEAAQRRAFRSKVDHLRPTYGFEDVSLAPGTSTIEPTDVDLAQVFCGINLAIPILASAMDAVVDARMAGELARLGGLAVLNLEGLQARYEDPDAVLERIASGSDAAVQDLLTEAYLSSPEP